MSTPTGIKQRGRLTRLPCGCAYCEEQWIELCEPHKADQDAIHSAAMQRKAAESPTDSWLD